MSPSPFAIRRAYPARLLAGVLAVAGVPGCLNEASFPAVERNLVRLDSNDSRLATREWAAAAHNRLELLLPEPDRPALTSASLPDNPDDIYPRFNLAPDKLSSVWSNFGGLLHTAQVAKGDAEGDNLSAGEPKAWPSFESVWIPVGDSEVRLFGRMAVHKDPAGKILPRDTVVVAVGFLGNLHGYRYRDLSIALYERGWHVLTLEMRGHGQTGREYPHVPITFGVLEAPDLLQTAVWCRANINAQRMGLIGFSWGALEAILAVWLDSDPGDKPGSDPLRRRVPPLRATPTFDAGVVAIAPILDMHVMAGGFDKPVSIFEDPIRSYVQGVIQEYQRYRKIPDPDHTVWSFVRYEAGRSSLMNDYGAYDRIREIGLDFLNVRGPSGTAKLESLRSPVLILHAANDPLSPAHLIAELGRNVSNPNVGVMMFPGGGHGGLPAVSAAYYYSLILNFFSPGTAPAIGVPPVGRYTAALDTAR